MEKNSTTSDSEPFERGNDVHPETDEGVMPGDRIRLMDLVSSIRKIEEYLIVRETEKPIQDDWQFAEGRSSFYYWLKETYRRRSLRSSFFNPNYFSGEAAWNMLLDLAASHIEGKRISVTSACFASEVPPTTALRWISLLEEDRLIVKENDFSDKRRTFLRISDKGMNLLSTYYNKIHSHEAVKRRKFDDLKY